MRKHIICLVLLAIVAAFLFPINVSYADAPNPVAPTSVTGSNTPPQGYPADFPFIPGGTLFYIPDQLKDGVMKNISIVLNYKEPAQELFEKLSAAAKAAGWTVDAHTGEEPDFKGGTDTRYRFDMKLGDRSIGGSIFREPGSETTRMMIVNSSHGSPNLDTNIPDVFIKNNKLIDAAKNGSVADVEAALADGADINAKDVGNGITALIWASQNNHIDVVKLLLDNGADVNVKNSNGVTSLIMAIQNSSTDIVKLLLDKGAEVNTARPDDSVTPLIMALWKGNADIVKLLLDKGADAKAKTTNGTTALMVASQKGNLVSVKLLLDNGADVNAKLPSIGITAIFMASQNGYVDVVKLLVEKGADVNVKEIKSGTTALIVATIHGQSEVAKLLLERGADINAKTTLTGQTALMMASQQGKTELAKLLVEKGADVNIKDDKNSGTALIWASANGHAEIVKLLIERGADVNANDIRGGTALVAALQGGHTDVMQLLKNAGAVAPDINNTDADKGPGSADKKSSDEISGKAELKKKRIELQKQNMKSVSFQMFLKTEIDKKYAEIFSELNLAPEKLDKLKNLIFDFQMASMEIDFDSYTASTDEEKAALKKRAEENYNEHQSRLKDLLGKAGYQKYYEYNERTDARSIVSSFVDSLGPDDKLTKDQEKALIEAMYKEQSRVFSEIGYDPNKTIEFASDVKAGKVDGRSKNMEKIFSRSIEKAKGILSASQMEQYKNFLKNYREMTDMNYKSIGLED
jgi:ankyrin repeat protein